jgi:hypothetical protein
MPPKCWLCLNNSDETAQKLNSFVLQNIACMDVESLTNMLHSHLELHFQQNMLNAEGASREEIKQHIQGSHLLCPSLQLAHNIRNALEMRDTLKSMVITEDAEGNKTVDSKNMSHYFKAVSEITQMYKTGEMNKMLFYAEEKVASGRV